MMAMASEKFAMMNPKAWVAMLRVVTLDPPFTMYISMNIKNNRSRHSISISMIRYSFSLGLKRIK